MSDIAREDNILQNAIDLLKDKSFKEAINLLTDKHAQVPDDAETLELLCYALIQNQQYTDAEQSLKRAIKLTPKNSKLYYNLGMTLKHLSQHDAAIAAYQKAISLSPNLDNAYVNIGNLYVSKADPFFAIEAYLSAIEINPNNFLASFNLAYQYEKTHQVDLAEKYYRIARNNHDFYLPASYQLAQLYIYTHQPNKAQIIAGEVLKKYPQCTEMYRITAHLITFRSDSDLHLAKINQLIAQDNIPSNHKIHLHFALGKIYHDLGSHAFAFEHYEKGNQLQYDLKPFDMKKFITETEAVIQGDNNLPKLTPCDEKPIFILGMPHAGKYLFANILKNHPKMNYLPHFGFHCFQTKPRLYTDKMSNAAKDDCYVIDNDFYNVLHIDTLKYLYPNATFIYCKRGHMDTALLNYFDYSMTGLEAMNNQKALAIFYRRFDMLMIHWKKKYRHDFLTVQYEDLIRKPHAVLEYLSTEIKQEIILPDIKFNQSTMGIATPYRAALNEVESVFTMKPNEIKALFQSYLNGATS